jgi:superfamily II DNA or RNA helicase
MMARSDELQAKINASQDWDPVICDEAHRMAASYFSGEVRETRRYKLGKHLGDRTRHLLLMSATPHNGKEADFQLFMGLLDADRFEGRFREGVHKADVSDMMRRLTKEELYRFDGTPLFPERRAYTASYKLSSDEQALYAAVTTYVREEMSAESASSISPSISCIWTAGTSRTFRSSSARRFSSRCSQASLAFSSTAMRQGTANSS